MKLNPADAAFGLCCKERSQWICERCGKQHHPLDRGLHTCHFQGRGAWATRLDPQNVFCMCYGCHSYLDGHKGEFEQFFKEKRGIEIYDTIMEKSRNIKLAKIVRGTHGKGEIASFYRECYAEMLRKRAGGVIGWLEFQGWV